ncbi:alpha-1,2-fucosyltransferase [Erysipelatoclostridium ramosum]|uniref:alpha-1,2-fucosyltransferase n=1 Tax=Thomasclavelia ramosa TaxID=1547 RepID=UPI00192B758F|nr:alpha-1,2-fucosyltransferase [Thomasclavelia ramosa]MCR1948253.1 alpha-1,2-fucosyltransferase [Thomasclavelia ramosa]QQY28481.1 alpha-1,2-fucosyltransferase [Thomasclavelia ramosa]
MKNINLRIMGGLGNQLYQYAAARYVQTVSKSEKIIIDVGGYERYKIRNLEINNILKNHNVVLKKNDVIVFGIVREIFHVYQRLYHSIFHKHASMSKLNLGKTTYLLSSIEFNKKKLNNLNKEIYMYGYFVSADIAQHMRVELQNEIVGPSEMSKTSLKYLNDIQTSNSVGISVRCGDDYKNNGWPVCSKEYYLSGINLIKQNYNNLKIFIFSDDIKKIKREKWFDGMEATYIDDVDVCESFELLRNCKNYVCSNSSFSWWGAFLSYNENAIIYSPNYIFADIRENEKVMLPNMVILDYITGEEIDC